MISIEQAFKLLRGSVTELGSELVDLPHLVGRVLVQAAVADVDSPPHDKSMMDGYAIRSQDLNDHVGSSAPEFEVIETVVAGTMPTKTLEAGQATRIMTGAPLPNGADAVIMIELATPRQDGTQQRVSFSLDSIAKEHHLLRAGTNFRAGDIMFQAGTRIRPHQIGLLAEVGVARAQVKKRPTVAVLPTGDELIGVEQLPGDSQIRNSNGPMLAALCRSAGYETTELPVARDQPDALNELVKLGLEHDVLILSGGVSAGQLDLVPAALAAAGVSQVFHKVKVKPGKPIWFGVRNADSPAIVFGLPGNPVSSLVGFELFVRAALGGLEGATVEHPQTIETTLACAHQTRGNRPTYWPASMVQQQDGIQVHPLVWNGSSDLHALGGADGLICFDAESTVHPAGKRVNFLAF